MRHVTSRHNPRLAEATALVASSRERRKSGKCVLEGLHVIATYAERHGAPETLIVTEAALARPDVRALVDLHAQQTLVVSESLLAAASSLPASVGLVAVVTTPQPASLGQADFNLLIDDVQDPGNVGSMLRSAVAAGVAQVLLSKHCAFAWSPKVLRAAQGAHFLTTVAEDTDLTAWATQFRAAGGRVVALDPHEGEPLFDAPMAFPLALAVGNEGAGLSDALLAVVDARVTIPMPGGMESLNAAAAAAVAMFECVRRALQENR